jgi:hypothetical protein
MSLVEGGWEKVVSKTLTWTDIWLQGKSRSALALLCMSSSTPISVCLPDCAATRAHRNVGSLAVTAHATFVAPFAIWPCVLGLSACLHVGFVDMTPGTCLLLYVRTYLGDLLALLQFRGLLSHMSACSQHYMACVHARGVACVIYCRLTKGKRCWE